MASRAVWKGQIRLSLVSIPVEIHPATQSGSRVSFRQIHGPSGKRIRYEKTVPGIGPVDKDKILKGYETDDEIILIEPDEIEEIKLETKKTLEMVQFVGIHEIAPLWFDRPYYVVPTDELAEDAYRVVRDALRRAGKIGLGQLTMRGRESLCAIRPCGDGLLLETLHYADEIRNADPLFNGIEDDAADDELLDVATQLIERKTAPFDASAFSDRYDTALRELIDAKRRNKKTPRVARGESGEGGGARGGENVVDLMDALKKSLDTSKSGTRSKSSGSRSASGSKSSGASKSSSRASSSKSPGKSSGSSGRGKKSA